jgi:hypothetical protein
MVHWNVAREVVEEDCTVMDEVIEFDYPAMSGRYAVLVPLDDRYIPDLWHIFGLQKDTAVAEVGVVGVAPHNDSLDHNALPSITKRPTA